MSSTDLESAPLLQAQEEHDVKVASFNQFTKRAVAAGSLLGLGALAVLVYPDAKHNMSASTSMDMFAGRDDISFCPNYYVMGITPRTAARGCVVVSIDDLFDPIMTEPKEGATSAHICLDSSVNEMKFSFDDIKDHMSMFYDEVTGLHSISTFAPGKDVDIIIFEGKNFDGETATVGSNEEGSLPTKLYPSGASANDNVGSFIILNKADHFFAGEDCGLTAQFCPYVMTKAEIMGSLPPGCILMSTRDVTEMSSTASAKTARVCGSYEGDEIDIDKRALQSMGMAHATGDLKSQVSYINQGKQVKATYFQGKDPLDGGASAVGTGSMSSRKWSDGTIRNDNMNSLKMKSSSSGIPHSC